MGCYYKTHCFPHVQLPGPVAVGSYTGILLTQVLYCATKLDQQEALLETVHEALTNNCAKTSVERRAGLCIVCTLINAASKNGVLVVVI